MQVKNIMLATFVVLLVAIFAININRYYQSRFTTTSDKSFSLKTVMRELWAQHVIWTREYIVSFLANAEDTKDVTQRLLQNQIDIGNAIIPYYGTDAGQKLAALLKDHILIATDVVSAAKANDQATLKKADALWHDNARDIAQFLSNANPHWPFNALQDMLYEHLQLTTQETVARIKKAWIDDIKMFDIIFAQAMMMADALSDGIIKQFPNKF